jgi:hypothetical protein
MYAKGQGVAKDDTQAADWFRKAAEQGEERAKNKIAEPGSSGPPAGTNGATAQIVPTNPATSQVQERLATSKKTDIRGLSPGMTVEEINKVLDEALDHTEIHWKTCSPVTMSPVERQRQNNFETSACVDHQRPVSFMIESGVGADTPRCRAFPVLAECPRGPAGTVIANGCDGAGAGRILCNFNGK